jgi:SAM-dependent methyltransferase
MTTARQAASPSQQALQAQAAYSGDPWNPRNPYFAHAEGFMDGLWKRLVYPFIEGSDFSATLDLAAGHGRSSAKLLRHARILSIMDIQPGNVEVCRTRFKGHPNVTYHVNNGYDLRPIGDGSLTLVYCFDAMVHFESDVVRSYLRDTHRVLAPGGRAFFHHSNYTGGEDWRTNPSSRNFMSKEFFAHYARKEGLKVLRQEVINWGPHQNLDCLTLVER